MNKLITRLPSIAGVYVALFICVSPSASAMESGATAREPWPLANQTLAQSTVPEKGGSAPAATQTAPLTWTFAAPQPADGSGWTIERGTLTFSEGKTTLRPDANRRVVLLSPPALPDAARYAESFVLGVSGTGLERVRVLARRDPRGGWITIADASGAALLATADGYRVKRNAGARDASIERLRFELQFRTTNPRTLARIVVH
jgi:hypothetical protein